MEVTAYGRQTAVPERCMVRSCDPLHNFGAPIISLERLNLVLNFVIFFVHEYAISILATGWHITNKRGVVMVTLQIYDFAVCRDAACRVVCQRQLSYLFFFVAGNHRHLKFGMWLEHSKSQPTDDKPSLKWAWSRHVTHFKFLVSLRYLWNGGS